MMQASQISAATKGTLVGADTILRDISINTREECSGRLFVALKGENFDSHDFIAQAEQAGAAAVLVEREVDTLLPMILVESTHAALLDLSAWWRRQFVIPVVGVTGSVGKTTVKEMLACIFGELGKGVVTKGNLNNEIGVPLTLMRLSVDDQYAIVEMGMNHAGEISRLTHSAMPTIAMVNNAGAAHLEGLGSVEAVAQAKGEIYQGLVSDGTAIVNLDDDYAGTWLAMVKDYKCLSFGLNASADVTAEYKEAKRGRGLVIKARAKGKKLKIKLNTIGEHSVRNALAAIAVATAAKVPASMIEQGLSKFSPVSGRLNVERLPGVDLIDDTYNANPASMRSAIKVLVRSERNILIVGDMAELGAAAEMEHKALGEQAAKRGVKHLLACGRYAQLVATGFGVGARAFLTQEELIDYLSQGSTVEALLGSADESPSDEGSVGTILVKGSRSSKMERVVELLHMQLGSDSSNDGRGEG